MVHYMVHYIVHSIVQGSGVPVQPAKERGGRWCGRCRVAAKVGARAYYVLRANTTYYVLPTAGYDAAHHHVGHDDCTTYGCSLHPIRSPPPSHTVGALTMSHTVAASTPYGCSLHPIRLRGSPLRARPCCRSRRRASLCTAQRANSRATRRPPDT